MGTRTEALRSSNDLAFSDIVVAIDDRPSSRRALATAARLALQLGLSLHVIAEHRPNGSGAEYSARRTLVEDARRSLVTTHPDLAAHVDSRVVVGDRIACTVCEAYPTAIVVMGTDRIVSRSGALVRYAAEDLARHAHHHPVVVVGPGVVDEWRSGPVAVALDGSPLAESALPAAIRWASVLSVPVEIVQVVPSATSALAEGADCSPYMCEVKRRVELHGVEVACRTVVNDDTAGTIVALLRERGCSLVFMATHGRHGIDREAFGSVVAGVVAQSPCPVRVARPQMVQQPILARI